MFTGMSCVLGYSNLILDPANLPPPLSLDNNIASYKSSMGAWYMKSMSVWTTIGWEVIFYALT